MKVVILCGGRGTRLREETEFKPKPLVEVCGKPILWHIMKGYASFGFNEFILCLGYKGFQIKEYFLNYDYFNADFSLDLGTGEKAILNHARRENWKLIFAETGDDTNTGGRVKKIEPYITEDYFFATYGDGVSDLDIRQLEQFYLERGKKAVITGLHPWSKYGRVAVDGEGVIQSFSEKPRLHDLINGGFFVLSRDIFDYLDDNCVLEREPFEKLAREREIALYKHEGFWHSMDTYKDYEELNKYTLENMPWRTW